MAKKSKPAEAPHLRIRLEPWLLAKLEKSREKNARTLTGEISYRLEQSFRRDDTEEMIKASGKQIAETLLDALSKSQDALMTKALEQGSEVTKIKGEKQ